MHTLKGMLAVSSAKAASDSHIPKTLFQGGSKPKKPSRFHVPIEIGPNGEPYEVKKP